jgi:glycerol-3-phosphate dehydrogenase
LWYYGSDAAAIQKLMRADQSLAEQLSAALPYVAAEVVWACRYEMARTVEDVLARRTRALFLNSKAALEMAPKVAALMAVELKYDAAWQSQELRRFVTRQETYIMLSHAFRFARPS